VPCPKHSALSLFALLMPQSTDLPKGNRLSADSLAPVTPIPTNIFCFFSAAYEQSLPPALARMPSTELGLIFFAGQQRLTRAQVAELPQVAAFRLSRPASIRRVRVWPPRMGPRMSLTVRSARSFYEWSQRTGPDDPSETNLPVFHSPSESGHMPAGGPVRIRDQAIRS
jgi:hypothetical protein